LEEAYQIIPRKAEMRRSDWIQPPDENIRKEVGL
jgi:hypothetical protein